MLIAHNIRSNHNIGSIIRTAECLGVEKIVFTGYSPYPSSHADERLPHVQRRSNTQIAKTSLGAEDSIAWEHEADIKSVTERLAKGGYKVVALEQTPNSLKLDTYKPPEKIALIIGNEADGVDQDTLKLCQECIEIPMHGKKESLNVVQATAIALYALQKA